MYLNKRTIKRNRLWLLCGLLIVIVSGMASRKYPFLFPAFLGKYPGDALWALMVYFGIGFIIPKATIRTVALYALVISYLDECSQLYQVQWLNSIRSTTVGHLILGSTFSWHDILAYAVGIAIGIGIEKLIKISTRFEVYRF